MDEQWVIEGWKWSGRDPRIWVDYGVKLVHASQWVMRGFNEKDETGMQPSRAVGLMGPMMMLRGMAIECILKGIAAKNGHRFDTDGNLVGDHDLVELAGHERIGFKLEENETNLLERLSYAVRTFGRYPIVGGKNGWKKGLFREKEKGSGEFLPWVYWSSKDIDAFDLLWRRMLATVDVEFSKTGSVVFRSKG